MKKGVSAKSYKLTLNLICMGQIFLMVAASMVALFLYSSNEMIVTGDIELENTLSVFRYLVPVVMIVSLSSGYFIFKTMLSKINASWKLQQKLPKYQVAVIIRSAFVELPGLMGFVAALMTGEMYFLTSTVLSIIILILLRPTLFSIAEDLTLSGEEKALLDNPDAIVSEIETTDS